MPDSIELTVIYKTSKPLEEYPIIVSEKNDGKPILNNKFLSKLGFKKNAKIDMYYCTINHDISQPYELNGLSAYDISKDSMRETKIELGLIVRE